MFQHIFTQFSNWGICVLPEFLYSCTLKWSLKTSFAGLSKSSQQSYYIVQLMNSITYDKCWHIINHVTRLLGFRFIDNIYFGMIFPDRIACFLFDCLFCFKFVLLNISSFIFCGTCSLKGVPSCEPELYEIELLQYIWQTTRSSFFLFTSFDSPDLVCHICPQMLCYPIIKP